MRVQGAEWPVRQQQPPSLWALPRQIEELPITRASIQQRGKLFVARIRASLPHYWGMRTTAPLSNGETNRAHGGSAVEALSASVHEVDWPCGGASALDQWHEVAARLAGTFPDRYVAGADVRWRLPLRDAVARSPDAALVRYRTIDVALRRSPGRPALLDVEVGNLFSLASKRVPVAQATATHPAQARWVHAASCVALDEQARCISRFIDDLKLLGINAEPAACRTVRIDLPRVVDASGEQVMRFEGRRAAYRKPAVPLPADAGFAVVASTPTNAHATADIVCTMLRELLGRAVGHVSRVRRAQAAAVNLVLLDPSVDLATDVAMRDVLRDWEARGIRFKLARSDAMRDRFAALNIVAELVHMAGARPWLTAQPQCSAVSLDAGHDHDSDRSRWVSVESDAGLGITAVRALDTARAEHLPPAVLDELWPSGDHQVLFRDGRLSQERERVIRRAAAACCAVLEIKKSPRALLWRNTRRGPLPAATAEAVIDPHDEWLVQTAPSSARDPVRPVRLRMHGGDPCELAARFIAQHAMPGPSLFHTARLPGAPGLADRISKLTAIGWTRAIGRGYRLSQLVP